MSFLCLQPPLITLTTDFGLVDTYVGVMKGVIYALAPDARLVDLTHEVSPQNVLEASARLEAAIDYFPPGTAHVVVVDPGVGSHRAACVVETERALFVAPDNGVLTLPLRRQPAVRAVRLTDQARRYCLPSISATFHGRDVFAPVAAHLAMGLELEALGEIVAPDALVQLALPQPQRERDAEGRACLRLHILYADRFGNLITDLECREWELWRLWLWAAGTGFSAEAGALEVFDGEGIGCWGSGVRCDGAEDGAVKAFEANLKFRAGRQAWQGVARTFADAAPGQPLAYWGSGGRLEIAVRDGNAAAVLALSPGDTLTLCV